MAGDHTAASALEGARPASTVWISRILRNRAGGRQGLLVLAVLLAGCLKGPAGRPPASAPPATTAQGAAATADVVEDAHGTIRKVGDLGFGIVPDADPGTRYAPRELAAEFQADGLRIVFSGRVTEAPEGVRLWGTPFVVTAIRRE